MVMGSHGQMTEGRKHLLVTRKGGRWFQNDLNIFLAISVKGASYKNKICRSFIFSKSLSIVTTFSP
jgi:hypothetical protein